MWYASPRNFAARRRSTWSTLGGGKQVRDAAPEERDCAQRERLRAQAHRQQPRKPRGGQRDEGWGAAQRPPG